MERIGQCHCGSLRVIATGEPDRVYLCHCKACQRRTGTAFHFGASYPKDRVRLAFAAIFGPASRFSSMGTRKGFLRWEPSSGFENADPRLPTARGPSMTRGAHRLFSMQGMVL